LKKVCVEEIAERGAGCSDTDEQREFSDQISGTSDSSIDLIELIEK
jgi:hypothetical protein